MWLFAFAYGLVAGSAVLVGAALAWFGRPPARLVDGLMAFGSGVLIAVVAFELTDEAFRRGGLAPTAVGYVLGAALFTAGLIAVDRRGARHGKTATVEVGTDTAAVVALATLLNGIPESLVIGLNFFGGETLAMATVAAVILSNVPEGIAATAHMIAAQRSRRYVFTLWTGVTLVGGLASLAGYLLFDSLTPEYVAIAQAIAGGALLVYIADMMIPEAFAEAHEAAGLVTALGFLAGYILVEALG